MFPKSALPDTSLLMKEVKVTGDNKIQQNTLFFFFKNLPGNTVTEVFSEKIEIVTAENFCGMIIKIFNDILCPEKNSAVNDRLGS